MDGYNFGEQNNVNTYQDPGAKGMAGMLIKWGIAKDTKTAEIILLCISLIFFGITAFLIYRNFL